MLLLSGPEGSAEIWPLFPRMYLFLTVPKNTFITYCICDTAPFLGNPIYFGAKYMEITEISLPHRHKNHEYRPHNIQGTAQRIEFNNLKKA